MPAMPPGGPPTPFSGVQPSSFTGGFGQSPGGPRHGLLRAAAKLGARLGGGQAFNPQMWAGSGVPNPQSFGQGGFNMDTLLPPPLQRTRTPPFTGA